VKPCRYIPERISPPSSACGPDSVGRYAKSSRMYVCAPSAAC
jgi:hypothetical protein